MGKINQRLTLSLLVLGVFANNHNFALALDDLALLAHGLDARSDFHNVYLLLGSPGDAAAGEVIGRHLNRYLVTREDADKIHPELAGNVRQDDMAVADIDLEHGIGQGFNHSALKLNYIVFRQRKIPPVKCRLRW
jgi:hypothetical protein